MRDPVMRRVRLIVAVIFVAASFVGLRGAAQIQNPIQAAKDAYNKAKQQQRQQQGQPQSQLTPAQPANTPSQPTPAQPQPTPNSAGASSPTQVSSTPAAGVDPSKLPDAVGIHLGMPIEQASAMMKSQFPAGTYTQTFTGSKFMNTSDKAWITKHDEHAY
jgi:hypothetical protein